MGGFGGDYGTSTASAFYTSATSTFTFWQSPSVPALMDMGPITTHPTSSATNGVTIQAPNALSTSYQLTFPTGLPGSTSFLTVDTSGNIATMPTSQVFNAVIPTGTVLAFASSTLPTPFQFLLCDGSTVSRTTYAALFAIVGTTWGIGDGSTTFGLPDFRGRFLRGQAHGSYGSTADPDALTRIALTAGQSPGDAMGSFQGFQNALHGHNVTDPGHSHNFRYTPGSGFAVPGGQTPGSTQQTGNTPIIASITGLTINSDGGNQSNPNNVYVDFYIKY